MIAEAERHETALTMRAAGFVWREIADELGVSIPGAKVLHSRARELAAADKCRVVRPKPERPWLAWPAGSCGAGNIRAAKSLPRPPVAVEL